MMISSQPSLASKKASSSDSGEDLLLLRRLAPYLLRYRNMLWVCLLIYPFYALSVVLLPWLLKKVLDEALPQANLIALYWFVASMAFLVFCEYILGFLTEYFLGLVGQKALRDLRVDLFEHVQRLPQQFFDKQPLGKIITRNTQDVEAIAELFQMGSVTMLADFLTSLAVLMMMWRLNAYLTLLCMCVMPLLLFVTVHLQRRARVAFQGIRQGISFINSFMTEHLQEVMSVKFFGQQQRTLEAFQKQNKSYVISNQQAILYDASLFAWIESMSMLTLALLLAFMAKPLNEGQLTSGLLVAFMQCIRRFFVPIRDMSSKYTVVQSAFVAAKRVVGLLDTPVDITNASQPVVLQAFRKAIVFEDVCFAYESRNQWVLQHIHLQIRRGERVALVGPTGSGKSSLLRLFNRTYDCTSGAITIDDVPVKQIELTSLRRLFSVVSQDVQLISGSLLDNLCLWGRISEQDVRSAVASIGCEAFIESFSQGYQTAIGDLGQRLSAGQKQLVAFIRAMAQNADILLLDEATSHIDASTEYQLEQATQKLLHGRTAVVVAHRLRTVQQSDRIVVLQHGCIVQQGDHRTLSQQPGMYQDWLQIYDH